MTDRAFMTSNHVLLGLIKLLKRDGKDTTVHKKAISQGDIEKLYSCGVFNVDSPDTLQNKVFWDVMLNFGRRGQEGLPELKSNSYHKLTDDKGMKYYTMAYNERDKTHHGVDGKENIKETRMYERPNDLNCPVHSLDLYLSKLSPKCSAFFQQTLVNPRPDCWYAAQPIGKNKLASWMSRISKSADLSKIYTNHCIKATVATVLSRQGVDLLKIMSVTGHRNVKSLESYINEPTDNERRTLSSALQAGTIPSASNVTTLTSNSRNSVCSSSDAGY
ncbi:KCTD1_15 [Mytilus edulis]|uniref:KCTD1_15 n=1 Tax=Mytilus edulis TaxID=6550 RepID=A0A8S3Q740_MYTED|nr:KCTD1_15 [Mytilus edulis]